MYDGEGLWELPHQQATLWQQPLLVDRMHCSADHGEQAQQQTMLQARQ
jgi:hypothetical protein